MKVGRPSLFRVVEWNKTNWGLFRWDTKSKKYCLVDTYKNESLANAERDRRYESRDMNRKFAKRVKDFNVRSKTSKGVVKL